MELEINYRRILLTFNLLNYIMNIENTNNTNIQNLINFSEREKLKEYLPYISCSVCGSILLEPKNCNICDKIFCNGCHVNYCKHKLTLSRHTKNIIEKLNFKCKFHNDGCKEIIKYTNLINHSASCKYFIEKGSDPIRSMKIEILNNDNNNLNASVNSNISLRNLKAIDEDLVIACKCGLKFSTRDKDCKKLYLEHKRECLSISSINKESVNLNKSSKQVNYPSLDNVDLSGSENNLSNSMLIDSFTNEEKDRVVSEFISNMQNVKSKFSDYMKQVYSANVYNIQKELSSFFKHYEETTSQIRNLEKEIAQYNLRGPLLEEDPEYMKLRAQNLQMCEEEEKLNFKIAQLQQRLLLKNMENEKILSDKAQEYRNLLAAYEIEEKWLKEELLMDRSKLTPNDIMTLSDDLCSLCRDDESSVKKHYCNMCRKKFCIGKCIMTCKSTECSNQLKYVCPHCNKACSLCEKNRYCSSCKVPCFYENCQNQFCRECYKKNEHQARSKNTNCKFFTCERDQTCECLMTSLFCTRCEKRLCKKCIYADDDHFKFLREDK